MGDDTITPVGELELWNRPAPGDVAPWVRMVVFLASVCGVLVVGAAAWTLWQIGHASGDLRGHKGTFIALPTFLMSITVVVLFLPDGTVSRFVRMAVALPLVHLVALVVALFFVPSLDVSSLGDRTPMMESMPVGLWFGIGLVLFAGLGRAIGGRRDQGWAHAFVMLALVYVLLFGLWLPIAATFPVLVDGRGYHMHATRALLETSPEPVGWLCLAPPLVVAALFTLLAVRAPKLARALRWPIALALLALFVVSVAARATANHGAFLVHDNFVHLLLAAVTLAIVATNALAITTWFAGRRALRGLVKSREGAITDEESEVVAYLQITSWLRGPRLWMRSFVANTSNELLCVPSGARLATALPKISSTMRAGESVVVLSKRDAISLGGFVERQVGDSPFRSTVMTVPGPSGITVGRSEPLSTPTESMLLAAWRPSVAYLLILLAIAVPSLIGLVVEGKP